MALTSTRVCRRGEAGDSRASTGGEFVGDGLVRRINGTPFSHRVLFGVVSAPVRYIRLSSWGWDKISMGV